MFFHIIEKYDTYILEAARLSPAHPPILDIFNFNVLLSAFMSNGNMMWQFSLFCCFTCHYFGEIRPDFDTPLKWVAPPFGFLTLSHPSLEQCRASPGSCAVLYWGWSVLWYFLQGMVTGISGIWAFVRQLTILASNGIHRRLACRSLLIRCLNIDL